MNSTRLSMNVPIAFGGLLAVLFPALCSAAPPDFVPRGWKRDQATSHRSSARFRAPDGHATLTMRDLDASAGPPSAVIQPRPGEMVTYRTRSQNWWVLSGYRGEEIFYRRASFACNHGRIHVIELDYPRDKKRRFDPIVTSISHRLGRFRDVCPKRAASR